MDSYTLERAGLELAPIHRGLIVAALVHDAFVDTDHVKPTDRNVMQYPVALCFESYTAFVRAVPDLMDTTQGTELLDILKNALRNRPGKRYGGDVVILSETL